MSGEWYKTLIVVSTTLSLLALVGNFIYSGQEPGGTMVTLLTTFLAIALVPGYLKRMKGGVSEIAQSIAEAASEEDPTGQGQEEN
ncbi:hypothetical protein IHN63_00355 [Deinococcus sp. 6YEL10]|uniref:hypothetical protein n=1 Tax=Deinococcus sp. 6YEL10 TaxID=2745870 RepID=UPI001E374C71|nr:hypothetical protein [Deinococcus sp. 6YEL10]MCD0159750.1 hypothetical protein [Deinococcus sp. 6YEL10]